ncbi:hypothetical protein ACQPZJ_06050 [Actinoplanes sp. CA-054009]
MLATHPDLRAEQDRLEAAEEKLFDADLPEETDTRMSAFTSVTKMPYDFSAARKRCIERTAQLLADTPGQPRVSSVAPWR